MSDSPKKIHRKKAAKREAALARAAAEVPKPSREENLKRALASVFTASSSAVPATASSVDTYGKGSATDRLQFGYAPAIAEEAVAFHSRISAASWTEARRANYKHAVIKKMKLRPANLEPLTSVIKLKHHWSKLAQFKSDVRGDGGLNLNAADDLLEMLAAKQRTG